MYAVVGRLIKGFNLNLTYRRWLLLLLDIILINVASIGAVFLRTDFKIPEIYLVSFQKTYIITTLILIVVFRLFNLYKSVWRYASIEEMNNVIFASVVGGGILFVLYEHILNIDFPRSYYILMPILLVFFVGGMRFSYRALRRIKMYILTGFYLKEKEC